MSPLTKFNRRTYNSPDDFFADVSLPIRNRKQLREIRQKGLISPAFQERLMMAVTAVNGCRYCSYYHAKEALKTGIEPEEIHDLLSGGISNCPENELVAVMYAQHWA
ncbi:carboxymuconolactone decarboxylase family protein [Chloroflexota bacterium]